MNKLKVSLYKIERDIWNWKANDNSKIPIYGKSFSTKKEALEDFKKFADSINIGDDYNLENIITKIWEETWKKVRNLKKKLLRR